MRYIKSNVVKHMLMLILGLLPLYGCIQAGTSTSSSSAPVAEEGEVIAFEGRTFDGPMNISSMVVGKKGKVAKVLIFKKCIFKSNLSFASLRGYATCLAASLEFEDCIFEGKVEGTQVQLLGSLRMQRCSFKKELDLSGCTFHAPVNMAGSTIDGDLLMANTIVMREFSFQDAHLMSISIFQASKFFTKPFFGNAIFHQNADFSLCRFAEGATLDYAKFIGKADFNGARFDGDISIQKGQAKMLNLSNVRALAAIKLAGTVIADSISKQGAILPAGQPQL